MTREEAIDRIKWAKQRLDSVTYSPETQEALNMAIEALKEMSHLHLICPHCLNDFYYNTITQSFEMKAGKEIQND